MTTLGAWGMVAWLVVLTALVGWAIYSVERSHHRIDTLGDRQDAVDHLARQVQDWWDDGEETGTEPGHSAPERPAEPLGHTDTPTSPEDGTGALKGSQPVDRVNVPLTKPGLPPVPAATVAIPAVTAEPDPHPPTQPALERRGIGAWIKGPGGSLVYRPTPPPEEKP